MQENLIFDIGLHKGEDTDFYLKKGYNVVAFEANPDLVAHCSTRFRVPIEQGRLRIIEGAITSGPTGKPVVFYKNTSNSIWSTISPDWVKRNEKVGANSVAVEVTPVDIADAFRLFGIPYYAKIDIEGADMSIIASLRQFSERPPYLSIESEKVDFARLENELQTLSSLGYKKFRVVQQATVPFSTIHTRDLSGKEFDHTFELHASAPFGDDITQPWLSYHECLQEYKRIFWSYRLFGDNSLIRKRWRGQQLLSTLERRYKKPLPGWYDTHATLL